MNSLERITGSILGGAIGDALAGPYEGATRPVTIDHQLEWRLSDDTQLTLATCEAISNSHHVDPAIISSTFVQWYRNSLLTGLGASKPMQGRWRSYWRFALRILGLGREKPTCCG